MKAITKAQRQTLEQIRAWIDQQPYQPNKRTKPAVPDLAPAFVLEHYVTPDPQPLGQYFTPPVMAQALHAITPMPNGPAITVLEPCAGIGGLLAGLPDTATVTAYELAHAEYTLGARLFPQAEWRHGSPFNNPERLASRFDVVLCNPPFGIKPNLGEMQAFAGRGWPAQYCFFKLAAYALKPGGVVAFIAPANFLDVSPKTFKLWLEEGPELIHAEDLPGEFLQTNIKVRGFVFRKPAPVGMPPARETLPREMVTGIVVEDLNDDPFAEPDALPMPAPVAPGAMPALAVSADAPDSQVQVFFDQARALRQAAAVAPTPTANCG